MCELKELEEIMVETEKRSTKGIREIEGILESIDQKIVRTISGDTALQEDLFKIDLEIALKQKEIEELKEMKEDLIGEKMRSRRI